MSLGQRVLVGEHRGTLRWKGEILNKEEIPTAWYGVEWDDPSRGKHNGMHKGVQYFTCEWPESGDKSASFIPPHKANLGITLRDGLRAVYEPEAVPTNHDLSISATKQIEFVGENEATKRMAEFGTMKTASVRGTAVATAGNEEEVAVLCPVLEELDVAHCLISSWEAIVAIASQLANLRVLNLQGNRITTPLTSASSVGQAIGHLNVLILSETLCSWEDCVGILMNAPNLAELHMAGNNIDSLDGLDTHNLKILNLQHNKLTWNEVNRLAKLPHLEALKLNHNHISSIEWTGGFPSLSSLSLDSNKISSWNDIQQLSHMPALDTLRLSRNPISGNSASEISVVPTGVRLETIARLSNITRLNGSRVREREHKDAERLYVKRCALILLENDENKDLIPEPSASFLAEHPMYPRLLQVHGPPAIGKQKSSGVSGTVADSLIHLSLVCNAPEASNHEQVDRQFPADMKVSNLRMLTARLYGLNAAYVRLFYRDAPDSPFPDAMNDDNRDISFYAVSDGGLVFVEYVQ